MYVDIQGLFTSPVIRQYTGVGGKRCCSTTPSSDVLSSGRTGSVQGESLCCVVLARRFLGVAKPGTYHSILCDATPADLGRTYMSGQGKAEAIEYVQFPDKGHFFPCGERSGRG
jgi:hypothetical protein